MSTTIFCELRNFAAMQVGPEPTPPSCTASLVLVKAFEELLTKDRPDRTWTRCLRCVLSGACRWGCELCRIAIKCLSPFGSSDASSTFCARPGREGQSRALQRSLVQRLIMAPESEGSGGSCGTGLRLLLGMLCDRGERSSDRAPAYSGALDRLRAAVGGRLSCNTFYNDDDFARASC